MLQNNNSGDSVTNQKLSMIKYGINFDTPDDQGEPVKNPGDSGKDQKPPSKDVNKDQNSDDSVDINELLKDPEKKKIFDLAHKNTQAEMKRKLEQEQQKLEGEMSKRVFAEVEKQLADARKDSKTEVQQKLDYIAELEEKIKVLESENKKQKEDNDEIRIEQTIMKHYCTNLIDEVEGPQDIMSILKKKFEVEDQKVKLKSGKKVEEDAAEFRLFKSHFYKSDTKSGNETNPNPRYKQEQQVTKEQATNSYFKTVKK